MSGPATLSVVVIPLIGGTALDRCLTSLAADRAERIAVLPLEAKRALCKQARIMASDSSPPTKRPSRGGGRSASRRPAGISSPSSRTHRCLRPAGARQSAWPSPTRRWAVPAGRYSCPRRSVRAFKRSAAANMDAFIPGASQAWRPAPPGPGGLTTVQHLPGNNLAYRRAPLLEALSTSQRGLVEIEIDDRLRAQGAKLVLQPGMSVEYATCDAHGARLSTRFRHGRLYAGRLVAGRGWPQRAAAFTKSLLLPAILAGRALRSAASILPPAGAIKAAPWICAMEAAWAAGEAVGSLTGEGRSEDWWQ